MQHLFRGRRIRRWAPWASAADRVEGEYDAFDVRAGYADYHAECHSRFTRKLDEAAPPQVVDGLGVDGRELLNVMSEAEAIDLRGRIEERFPCRVLKEKSQHLQVYDMNDAAFGRELLEKVLTPGVDARISRFFGSEYLAYWILGTRAVPVEQLGFNSFRWHCDKGPRAHLKLIVYLSHFDEHHGGTEFLDLSATRELRTTGYVFAPVKKRLADLAELAEREGVAYEPWLPKARAGEGVLFQPGRVLHRGVVPSHGARVALTICLLPSPVPWREAFARGVFCAVGEDAKWHADAGELRAALA